MSASTSGPSAWPRFFPADCPPDSAPLASGSAYRLVRSNPPAAADFQSYAERGVKPDDGDECKACALSVYRGLDDILALRRTAKGFRRRSIAEGPLSVGSLAHTPSTPTSTHHSWWIPDGAKVHDGFSVVCGPEAAT